MTKSSGTGRRRFFNSMIHQRYGGSLAFLYVLLAGMVALVAPLAVGATRMSMEAPSYARREFIILVETIWPALPALLIAAAVVSIYLTNRHGGPLYRVHMVCKKLAAGKLSTRMCFRSSDHLDDLAAEFNQGVERVDDALGAVRAELDELRKMLEATTEQLAEHDLGAARDSVKAATAGAVRMSEALAGFDLSAAPGEPPVTPA